MSCIKERRRPVSCLCRDIQQIQREAAALTTGELRSAIETDLGILAVVIDQLAHLCTSPPQPAGGADLEYSAARDLVFMSALTTALYTRELAHRPAKRTTYIQTSFSPN
jgi:hypothetical protein